jgi:hypothetical protein
MSVNDLRYYFMPAGVYTPSAAGGLGIYTRFVNNKINHIEVVQETITSLHLKCPDRDLLLVTDLHMDTNIRPLDTTWDELYVVSPHMSTWRDVNVPFYMMNYPKHIKNNGYSPKTRVPGSPKTDGSCIVSDSGGFQLLTGQTAYLDPAKIGKWYSDNIDVGIILVFF